MDRLFGDLVSGIRMLVRYPTLVLLGHELRTMPMPFAIENVMRRSVVQLVIGVVLGLVLAIVAAGALRPVLYRVDPRDVTVFAGVVVMLVGVGLVASLLPARRVAKIGPVKALATE